MSSGTIDLTNKSDKIVGTGTTFTADLKVGDVMVVPVGAGSFTLIVKSIETDTGLTLVEQYKGPTLTGQSWSAVPYETMLRINAQLSTQTGVAIYGLNMDKQNWQAVFSESGDITVTLPDTTTFTGPSWKKISELLDTLDPSHLDAMAAQIRTDAQQVATDKPIIVQAKDDAIAAKTAAEASETAAKTSETNSAASKDAAKVSEDNAAESARQAAASNPLLALQKSLNLSDLADRAAAWLNVRPIGATPLAADPVSDYDAATKRWVQNLLSSGTAGPTMNGVMNLGVGSPVMWETRAYIPPYCLPRDGQLVNRADWPELWAWAQKTTPITDAAWLDDVTKRGSYSTGNGTTTFRLPDWNGVQSGSIPGVFFRGGVSANDMKLALNAAPNITGSFGSDMNTQVWIKTSNVTGAFSLAGQVNNTMSPVPSSFAQTPGYSLWSLDASKSNAAYGRNNATEITPNLVNGVWLVRASGGFEAANTSWSVWNSDTTMPGNGTVVRGGSVRSAYQAAGAEKAAAELQAVLTTSATGVKTVTAEIVVKDSTGGTATTKTIKLGTVDGLTGGSISGNIDAVGFAKADLYHVGGQIRATMLGEGRNVGLWNEYREGDIGNAILEYIDPSIARRWLFQATGNATSPGAWTPNSDSRLKKDKVRIEDPLGKMRQMYGYTWTRLDGGQWGIGFLAQEVAKLFPQAVSVGQDRTLDDGTVVEGVLSPDTYGVAAALHHEAILKLMDKIEALEAEIAELKAK